MSIKQKINRDFNRNSKIRLKENIKKQAVKTTFSHFPQGFQQFG